MKKLTKKITSFFKDEEGATAVEYAIMVALIAIVVIGAVTLLGQKTCQVFSSAAGSMLPG